jgi:hypothetical protein
VVTDIVTSNAYAAVPASAASNPYADPQAVTGTQGNAFVAAIKTTIGATGSAVSAAQPTVIFANPS